MKHTVVRRALFGLLLLVALLVMVTLYAAPTSSAQAVPQPVKSEVVNLLAPHAPTANWKGWQNLGDVNGNDVFDPVIGQNADGHLELLAWANYGTGSTDHAVYRRNQTAVNGSSWTAWTALGTLEAGTFLPALATNPAGRIEAFAQGDVALMGGCTYRSAIKQIAQTSPNGGWGSWYNMGQPGTCSLREPRVGMNSDGRLDVFAYAETGDLYHRWQTMPSGDWVTSWTSLGKPGPSISDPVAVGNNADGRLELFVIAGTSLFHNWQTTAGVLANWSGWSGFSNPSGVSNLYNPTLTQNLDGRLDVMTRGSDGHLWHVFQGSPNSAFSGWEDLGKPSSTAMSSNPKATRMRDGRLVVFAIGGDGALWSLPQTQINSYWASWTSVGKPSGVTLSTSFTLGMNQNGTMVIAATDTSGTLWVNQESLQVFLPLIRR